MHDKLTCNCPIGEASTVTSNSFRVRRAIGQSYIKPYRLYFWKCLSNYLLDYLHRDLDTLRNSKTMMLWSILVNNKENNSIDLLDLFAKSHIALAEIIGYHTSWINTVYDLRLIAPRFSHNSYTHLFVVNLLLGP